EDYLEFPFMRHAYVFSVCRIEPENNIHMLLEAFSGLPDRQLVIVGNWNASKYGRDLREQFGTCHNIRLLDPIYEPERLNLLRSNCFAYVHGHSAGGTNPSLVEAMYLGLPVLAYDVSFNRATTDNQAFFFQNAAELATLLKDLRLNDYHTCAKAMGRIADERYTWRRVAEMYKNRIDWLTHAQSEAAGQAPRPVSPPAPQPVATAS
ncbi:MAG: glycosyltransferase, partial [Bacteroidota bacterium]